MIAVVPFSPKHADLLTDPEQEPGMLEVLGKNAAYWQAMEESGKAFSAFWNGTFLGCGGFFVMPWGGTAEAWMWALPEAKRHPLAVHRLISRMIETIERDYGVFRISCTVKCGNEAAIRWMKLLRFREEAVLRKFGPGQSDFFLFARIKD